MDVPGKFPRVKMSTPNKFSQICSFCLSLLNEKKAQFRSYVLFFSSSSHDFFFDLMNLTITGFKPFGSFDENPSSIVGQPVSQKLSKTNPKLNLFKLTHPFLSAIRFI
jgi:hypothetical protein